MKIAMKSTMLVAVGVFATVSGFVMAQDKMSDGKMAGKAMVTTQDKTFMVMAEQSNLGEIGTSQLALKKSSDQGVKDFAQKMIDDHTKAEDELKQLASSKGVKLPGDPGAKNKAALAKLQALNGAAFNSSYTKVQKNGHDTTIVAFQKELAAGKDSDTKAYAQKYLPAIQEHDKMAANMKMGMKGKM